MYHAPLALQCIYMYGVMIEVKMGMERRVVSFLEGGRKWRLPGLLYADDLVLCCEAEEDLRVVVGWFAEVCRRRGLQVNVSEFKDLIKCFGRFRYRWGKMQ